MWRKTASSLQISGFTDPDDCLPPPPQQKHVQREGGLFPVYRWKVVYFSCTLPLTNAIVSCADASRNKLHFFRFSPDGEREHRGGGTRGACRAAKPQKPKPYPTPPSVVFVTCKLKMQTLSWPTCTTDHHVSFHDLLLWELHALQGWSRWGERTKTTRLRLCKHAFNNMQLLMQAHMSVVRRVQDLSQWPDGLRQLSSWNMCTFVQNFAKRYE